MSGRLRRAAGLLLDAAVGGLLFAAAFACFALIDRPELILGLVNG